MRTILILLACLSPCLPATAQMKWANPAEAPYPAVQNQGWTDEIGRTYTRLPQSAEGNVPVPVWNLSRQSAGLAVHFYSDAPEITVRYAVGGPRAMNHMPATGVSGVDLYRIDPDGGREFCSGDFSFGDTVTYRYRHIRQHTLHNNGYEYRLYLPLYNSVKWLEIGVPEAASLEFVPASVEKPVVVYGTSVVQGACASRPALAWPSVVGRALDGPLVNLGFSGSARMEKEVMEYVAGIDARLYVLDCLPNMFEMEEKEVAQRIIDAVRLIRRKSAAPVLLVEHVGNSNARTDSARFDGNGAVNDASLYAYRFLQHEDVPGIHYIFSDEFKIPADGWVDYVHLNDWGMQSQAATVEKKIREILKMPEGASRTGIPVSQRREPLNYEWQKRHQEILAQNKSNPPQNLIIGSSTREPDGYRNLGFGSDRIENILWRVYHGELDGFDASKVILSAGANNLDTDTDPSIVDGLRLLINAVRQRQPQALVKVLGIYPRRHYEDRIKGINHQIEEMAKQCGFLYQDAGNMLLNVDGKIDESLFTDGIHPNEEGYNILGMILTDFE